MLSSKVCEVTSLLLEHNKMPQEVEESTVLRGPAAIKWNRHQIGINIHEETLPSELALQWSNTFQGRGIPENMNV